MIAGIKSRVISKVKRDSNGCWIWQAHKNNKGYGVLNIKGVKLAHRLSYESVHGPIPVGMKVLHKCDNPACVNPTHLKIGTQKENIRDMVNKGRDCKGERASFAKLTYKIADEIRKLYATGNISMRKIASKFGVSYFTINYIINNKRWIR